MNIINTTGREIRTYVVFSFFVFNHFFIFSQPSLVSKKNFFIPLVHKISISLNDAAKKRMAHVLESYYQAAHDCNETFHLYSQKEAMPSFFKKELESVSQRVEGVLSSTEKLTPSHVGELRKALHKFSLFLDRSLTNHSSKASPYKQPTVKRMYSLINRLTSTLLRDEYYSIGGWWKKFVGSFDITKNIQQKSFKDSWKLLIGYGALWTVWSTYEAFGRYKSYKSYKRPESTSSLSSGRAPSSTSLGAPSPTSSPASSPISSPAPSPVLASSTLWVPPYKNVGDALPENTNKSGARSSALSTKTTEDSYKPLSLDNKAFDAADNSIIHDNFSRVRKLVDIAQESCRGLGFIPEDSNLRKLWRELSIFCVEFLDKKVEWDTLEGEYILIRKELDAYNNALEKCSSRLYGSALNQKNLEYLKEFNSFYTGDLVQKVLGQASLDISFKKYINYIYRFYGDGTRNDIEGALVELSKKVGEFKEKLEMWADHVNAYRFWIKENAYPLITAYKEALLESQEKCQTCSKSVKEASQVAFVKCGEKMLFCCSSCLQSPEKEKKFFSQCGYSARSDFLKAVDYVQPQAVSQFSQKIVERIKKIMAEAKERLREVYQKGLCKGEKI